MLNVLALKIVLVYARALAHIPFLGQISKQGANKLTPRANKQINKQTNNHFQSLCAGPATSG